MKGDEKKQFIEKVRHSLKAMAKVERRRSGMMA
jgi:hypothetical protein